MIKRKRNCNIEDIKDEVIQWRAENKQKVEINLFPGEEEYLTQEMNCIVSPSLYKIKSDDLQALNDCPNFLKNKKDKKIKKIFKLKKREKKLLDKYGIRYQPLQYVVYL